MQKFIFLAITFFFFGTVFGQSIEKTWQFQNTKDENGLSAIKTNPETNYLKLENGLFEYQMAEVDSLKSNGDYIFQNNLLLLFFNNPNDSIRRFRVTQVTDSTLALSENNFQHQLKVPSDKTITALESDSKSSEIIPSQGFSMQSLWRGILGMVSLIIIAFLFSSNKKAISWKTVGIGLAFQLLIAIGVLKVNFIKNIFEIYWPTFYQCFGLHTSRK